MNRNYISLPFDSDIQIVLENLSNEKIKIIPLCNGKGQVVDYADQKNFHTIPVLSPSLEGNEMKYLADCVRSNWISSQGKYTLSHVSNCPVPKFIQTKNYDQTYYRKTPGPGAYNQ